MLFNEIKVVEGLDPAAGHSLSVIFGIEEARCSEMVAELHTLSTGTVTGAIDNIATVAKTANEGAFLLVWLGTNLG